MGTFETIAKEVEDYEQTIRDLDRLEERRYLCAASQGKLGVLRGQLIERNDESNKLLEELRVLEKSREASAA